MSAKRSERGLPFLGILIRLISAMRVLFKPFFTIFGVTNRMLKLPVSAQVLRLPLQPTKSKLFQFRRGLLNPGYPEIHCLGWREGFLLEYQASFTGGLRVLSGSGIRTCLSSQERDC